MWLGYGRGKEDGIEMWDRSLIMFSFELDKIGAWGTVQWVLGIQTKKGKESSQVGEAMNVYETPPHGDIEWGKGDR